MTYLWKILMDKKVTISDLMDAVMPVLPAATAGSETRAVRVA